MSQIHEIDYKGTKIAFRLQRSKRRTLAITVQPNLDVEVIAPDEAALETVLTRVRKRAVWIKRQQQFFSEFLPQTPPRRYVSGETHRYLGRQYRLKVIEASPESAKLKGRFLCVNVKCKSDLERVQQLVQKWYLERARSVFARSLADSLPRFHGRIKDVPPVHIRNMPKRWGSWTRRGGIYLNPELVRAPRSCIDYVLTHELCHLVYGNHGKEFFALLQRTMPDWEERKARLEISMSQ